MTGESVLLDTHIFVWATESPERLSAPAKQCFAKGVRRLLSVASVWELAIKASLGRFHASVPLPRLIEDGCQQLVLQLRPIERDEALMVSGLQLHHRDPFDRLLVATAIHLRCPIVSKDVALDAYPIRRIW